MQQFIRTVNTKEAFELKMQELEREYLLKLQPIDEEIDRLDAEMDSHALKGVGGEFGGGFLRFISWIAFILGVVALIIVVVGFLEDGASEARESMPLVLGLSLFGIFMLILGGVWRSKGNRMYRRAMAKQEAAERMINHLEAEIEDLREKRMLLEEHYMAEMQKQKALYQNHMLNQKALLEQEVSAIQQARSSVAVTSEETKECPRCAEVIKARAKVCRYCNYEFEV